MARERMIESQLMEVPWPYSGVCFDSSFYMQPKGTCPDAMNVVPYDCISGKRRGSRRPGVAKFITDQFDSGSSIQDIITVSVSIGQVVGTGNVYGHGATTTTYKLFKSVQADTTPEHHFETGSLPAHSMGCTDEDNNVYSAHVTTRTVTVVKYGTDYTLKWTATLTLAGSGNAAIFGIAAYDGTVYVYAISQTTSAITSPGIYRFKASDGTQRETTPWLQPTTLAYVSGITTTAEITTANQGLVAGSGVVAVIGSTTLAGGNLVLQQFSTDTGLLKYQTTLEAFSSYPAKVVMDRGANVYVLSNRVAGTQIIYKVNSGGSLVTAFDTDGKLAMSGAKDFCYDPVNFQLAVVGTNVGGLTFSFQRYNATTGAAANGYDPYTFTTWNAIAADGIDDTNQDGGLTLRRSVAAANADIVHVNAAATTDAGANPPRWSLISSLGVISDTLWVVHPGLQVAPQATFMRSVRTTRFLVVAGGNLYSVNRLGEASLVKEDFLTSGAPVVYSTVNNLTVFYTDGFTIGTYNFSTGVAGTLTAATGEVPTDDNGWKCTLITTWRNRLVMARLLSDLTNWYMSEAGDSTKWLYSSTSTSPLQAIAGNNAEAGKVPGVITALIPHTDNMLIFGGEQAIYRLTGDPADFGRMDLVSDQTGMALGRAWCKDPAGVIYFFGSRGGLWRMGAADIPQRISTNIDSELNAVNQNTHLIRLAWDDQWEGVHVVISPIDATKASTHYWWDSETPRQTSYQVIKQPGSWWPWEFKNKNHNAMAIHVLDSDDPEDRVVLWGGRDGYIRYLSSAAINDDGYAITSSIIIGPVHMKEGGAFRITDLQATLASDSEDVEWAIQSGECVESAFNDTATGDATGTFTVASGTFGRQRSQAVRANQHAAFVVLSSDEEALRWSVEEMRLVIQPLPMGVSQRAF